MEGKCEGTAIIHAVGNGGYDMDLDFNYTFEYTYEIVDEPRLDRELAGRSVDDLVAAEMKGGMTIVSIMVPPGYIDLDKADGIPAGYEEKTAEWLGRQMELRGCRITGVKLTKFELTETWQQYFKK